jgi:3',5'-cyclic AMP phosphodiesterase CpdA
MINKLVYIADLHFCGQLSKLEAFVDYLYIYTGPQVIILGGDIATSLESMERVLDTFRAKFKEEPLLVIAGNHDLWINNNDCTNSYTIYSKLIPNLCKKYGATYLDQESTIVETYDNVKWGICGTLGWYDYSAKYKGMPLPDEWYAYNKKTYNNDGNYVFLKKGQKSLSDKQFSEYLLKKLKKEINKVEKDVDYLLICTHVPVFPSSIRYREHRGAGADWNNGTAYFYNLTLGEYIKTIDKVKLVLSGHTHTGFDGTVSTEKGAIREVISASDYGHAEVVSVSFYKDILFEVDRFFINDYLCRLL